jgi:hypothetical protein
VSWPVPFALLTTTSTVVPGAPGGTWHESRVSSMTATMPEFWLPKRTLFVPAPPAR